MNIRNIASIAVAILLGLVAVILVRAQLNNNKPAQAVAVAGMTPVVVASQAIERGATLQPGFLKVVNYPTDSVPSGAFTDVAALSGQGDQARLALRAIAANEPIMTVKVSEPGGKANLSASLTPGMRAIGVRSSDVTGVGGFALPGDRVDVMVTREVGKEAAATTVTQILAENVRVLGVDQSDDVDADKPVVAKAVTIEVTPDQAQAISLAQQVGTVSLSLRQVADDAALARKSLTANELGRYGPPPVARPRTVRVAARPSQSGLTEVHVTRGTEISGYPVRAE